MKGIGTGVPRGCWTSGAREANHFLVARDVTRDLVVAVYDHRRGLGSMGVFGAQDVAQGSQIITAYGRHDVSQVSGWLLGLVGDENGLREQATGYMTAAGIEPVTHWLEGGQRIARCDLVCATGELTLDLRPPA
jgi:hypothetical protein